MLGRPLLLVLVSLACAAPAAAQDRELARSTFEEAERQFAAGNHQLALEGFRRSRELVGDDERARALLLFNIARAQEELGRYREAERSFSQFLNDAPSDAPFREETLDRVRELRARLAAQSEEQGAVAEEAEPPSEEAAPATAGPSPLVPVGIAVLAVGGAAALASVPTGVIALDGASTLEARCPGGACPPSEASLIDDTHAMSIATDVLWVAGLSIAAVGGVLLGIGLSSSEDTVEASAMCLPDRGCVAQARGRF